MRRVQQPNIKTKKRVSKQRQIIRLLKRKNGASLAEIGRVADWQDHSIRGFISGTIRKRLGMRVESFKDGKGTRRYRIDCCNEQAESQFRSSGSKRALKQPDMGKHSQSAIDLQIEVTWRSFESKSVKSPEAEAA